VIGGVRKLDFRPQKPRIQPGLSSSFIRVTTTVAVGSPSVQIADVVSYWLQLQQSVQTLLSSMETGFLTFSEQIYGQAAGVGAIVKNAEVLTVSGVQSYGVGVLADTFGAPAYADSVEVPLSVYVCRDDGCRTVMRRFCDDLRAWQRLVGAVLRTQQSGSGSGSRICIPTRSVSPVLPSFSAADNASIPCLSLSLSSYPGVTLYMLTTEWCPDVSAPVKPCEEVSAGAGAASDAGVEDDDSKWEITMEDGSEPCTTTVSTPSSQPSNAPVVGRLCDLTAAVECVCAGASVPVLCACAPCVLALEASQAVVEPALSSTAAVTPATSAQKSAAAESEGSNTMLIALALVIAVIAALYAVLLG
jgi:hypothetical protein